MSRLLVARFELDDGRGELAANTDAGAYKAIKSFHDALETFLIAVADHVGVARAHRHMHEYPRVLEKATAGVQFKHTAVLNQVNALRTPAKHDAIYPHPDAVRQISARLDPVFEDNARQYLGTSFFGLRMAITIRHQQCRSEIAAAEDAFEQKRYGEALGLLRVAFEVFLNETARPGAERLLSRSLEDHVAKITGELRHEVGEVNRRWIELVERFRLVDQGINVADYDRFVGITPTVFIPGDPRNRTIYRSPNEDLVATHENAAFALTFVLETIRRIEKRGRTRSVHSRYRVRAKAPVACVAWAGSELVEVDRLAKDEEVPNTQFALGPAGWQGNAWTWEKDGRRLLVPFESCDIVDEQIDARR